MRGPLPRRAQPELLIILGVMRKSDTHSAGVTCDREFRSKPGSIIGDSGDPPLGTDCWLCIGQCVATCSASSNDICVS